MSGYNQANIVGNYNGPAEPKPFVRQPMPAASFTDSVDGGNDQLRAGLRLVRTYALEALTPLVGDAAAEVGAREAEFAFASSFASARCNFRSSFAAPGVYQTSNPGGRPLAFGPGFRDAFVAAHRELVSSAGDPMSAGRAAVAATNEARKVTDASLVAIEAFTTAAVAGARAALSAMGARK